MSCIVRYVTEKWWLVAVRISHEKDIRSIVPAMTRNISEKLRNLDRMGGRDRILKNYLPASGSKWVPY